MKVLSRFTIAGARVLNGKAKEIVLEIQPEPGSSFANGPSQTDYLVSIPYSDKIGFETRIALVILEGDEGGDVTPPEPIPGPQPSPEPAPDPNPLPPPIVPQMGLKSLRRGKQDIAE